MGFMLGPILRTVDIAARKAVLLGLTPRTLFLMPTLSIITGTTGWYIARDIGLLGPALAAVRLGRSGAGAGYADVHPGTRLSVAGQSARLSGAAKGQA